MLSKLCALFGYILYWGTSFSGTKLGPEFWKLPIFMRLGGREGAATLPNKKGTRKHPHNKRGRTECWVNLVEGFGFRGWGSGFRGSGLGFRVGGFRVWWLGFRD